MSGTNSASILFLCSQTDFCLTQINSCLLNPQETTLALLDQLLSLPSSLTQRKDFCSIKQNDPDLTLVTAEETSIGVSQIRELRTQMGQKPTHRQTKIAIFPTAEKLTPEAQNALLKILEEPPENAIIILIAPDLNLLLSTVVSRCHLVYLPAPTNSLLPEDQKKANEILKAIDQHLIGPGFTWARSVGSKRADAQLQLEKLLQAAQKEFLKGAVTASTVHRLFHAKKYLSANTNVRLTLENLFLN